MGAEEHRPNLADKLRRIAHMYGAPEVEPGAEDLPRAALDELQGKRLFVLLKDTLRRSSFYASKFRGPDPVELARYPFTTKAELTANQEAHPPYGTGLTLAYKYYSRLHRTSGTSGRPLLWLDTPETWQWMLNCWQAMFRIVGLGPADHLFFPFSFGPFLGFWTAFEAAVQTGYFCLPAGGMSSVARLRYLLDHEATVVFCTPTYALRLAEVAQEEGIDLAASLVRVLIVAGELGGSIPATRARIEAAWGARVFDHAGMTEIGPVAVECRDNPGGLHVLETDYVAEVIDPATTHPVAPGQVGELVLTNLGRWASPLIRYRTGDLVRVDPRPCPCGRALLRLDGGILGRVDDMIHVRGNNLYPSALEGLIRRFPDVAEYRVEIDESAALPVVRIEVEASPQTAERVDRAVRDELLFRAEVRAVAPGSLPRFEMKARRISRKGAKAQREDKGEPQ